MNQPDVKAIDQLFASEFVPEIPIPSPSSERSQQGSTQRQPRLHIEELEDRYGPSMLSMASTASNVAMPVHRAAHARMEPPLRGYTHDIHGVAAMASGLVNQWEVPGLSLEERNALDALHASSDHQGDAFGVDALAININAPQLRIPHAVIDCDESSPLAFESTMFEIP
ncbi:hypothetical protein HY285_05910 [Candidatus Peregrinibacteria bacterium]|nr:hypothetical protein [Candidatus Peregrinibacteria bacterium]MBI3817041.1 hypothetical protein [Candidatus Peregrinibacteria bacterium]